MKLLVGVWVLLLMAGCGFALRGTVPISDAYQPIAVSGLAENHQMRLALERELVRRQAASQRAKAKVSLHVVVFDESSHVMAVDGIGSARDRQLLATLVFRLDGVNGENVRGDTRVTVSRFFQFDATNVLGRKSEEEYVRTEMRREIVERVMHVLSSPT